MLAEGSMAPNFELDGSDGKRHSLKDYLGRYLILYFYPRDNTPGCTVEAKEYNKHLDEIRGLDADVVGVSNDDLKSHGKFRDKLELGFVLLSDPKSETIKAYDSWGDRGIFGVGTIRNTFIIDKNGRIARAFKKVSPDAHVKEVISFLKNAK